MCFCECVSECFLQPMWCQEQSSFSDSRTFQPHGGQIEKPRKKREILAFTPLPQEVQLKNLTIRKIFWSSNTKAYRNGAKLNYIHSPMVLSKFFDRSIQGIATWNSREKIKLAIQHDQNYGAWLVKDGKTVFRNSDGKFRCQYQVSRQARARLAVFPSQNFRYFSAF